ncbi:transcriptional regulator, TetR family [Clostridium sp. ASBs410]|jgi:AcrR family transcriptional regulator|nr:transcriptional regulator, TetR family [Clostridium sp. ASBs410]
MGRNKYPEQTLEKIIETSTQLFIEKGYEQTSIQDILDALNLSKGGLYHHFKSKEEILEVVMHKRAQYISDALNEIILNTKAKNAKEKLKKILHYLSADTETHLLDTVLTSQVNNPYFVVSGLQTCMKQDAPIIRKLIESGIEDGSLQITQPDLCAEIFLLLLNFWINPVLFGRDLVETRKRLSYLQSLMSLVGMDVIDNDFIDLIINGYDKMGAFSK